MTRAISACPVSLNSLSLDGAITVETVVILSLSLSLSLALYNIMFLCRWNILWCMLIKEVRLIESRFC